MKYCNALRKFCDDKYECDDCLDLIAHKHAQTAKFKRMQRAREARRNLFLTKKEITERNR
jgi:hypothetical protein